MISTTRTICSVAGTMFSITMTIFSVVETMFFATRTICSDTESIFSVPDTTFFATDKIFSVAQKTAGEAPAVSYPLNQILKGEILPCFNTFELRMASEASLQNNWQLLPQALSPA
jgi:hypothetical protein